MIRFVAGLAGLILVASAAHVNIIASGGYEQSAAIVTLALAIGVAVGAAAIGTAAGHGRMLLAFAIGLGLLAGEAYALLSTSERVIVAREEMQAPLREARKKHDDAARRVTDASEYLRKLDDMPAAVSAREVAAKAALEAANKSVREQAALRGCRQNCRQLLQAQADDARKELEAAQDEAVASGKRRRAQAEQALADAKQALKAAPLPGSATPLADRLGVEPWLLDVIAAGLLSIGVNGLGAALIALAAHTRAPAKAVTATAVVEPLNETRAVHRPVEPPKLVALPTPSHGRVSRFVVEQLEAATRSKVEVVDLYKAYATWCSQMDMGALDVETFGDHLQEALEIAGIETKAQRDKVYLMGVGLKAA